MGTHVQIAAIVGTAVLFAIVFELVRQRRLLERYAILWLFSALVLLVLAIWTGLLGKVAAAVGIHYPPSALFLIAFVFVLVLLLHFSVAVSRQAEQSKVLAQRLALLERRVRDQEQAAKPREEPVATPGSAYANGDRAGPRAVRDASGDDGQPAGVGDGVEPSPAREREYTPSSRG